MTKQRQQRMEDHPICALQALEQTIEREGHNLQSTSMYIIKYLEDYTTLNDANISRELQVLRGTFHQIHQCIDSIKSIVRRRLHYPHDPLPADATTPPAPRDSEREKER